MVMKNPTYSASLKLRGMFRAYMAEAAQKTPIKKKKKNRTAKSSHLERIPEQLLVVPSCNRKVIQDAPDLHVLQLLKLK
jgi:hypothetical protein